MKRGQRVSRKDSDAGGDRKKSRPGDPVGGVRVTWDDGSTSYYARNQEANVRDSSRPVPPLIICSTCNSELRLFGIGPESATRTICSPSSALSADTLKCAEC